MLKCSHCSRECTYYCKRPPVQLRKFKCVRGIASHCFKESVVKTIELPLKHCRFCQMHDCGVKCIVKANSTSTMSLTFINMFCPRNRHYKNHKIISEGYDNHNSLYNQPVIYAFSEQHTIHFDTNTNSNTWSERTSTQMSN